MNVSDDAISAPNRLSITYCPAHSRPFFELILAFDSRLKDVASRNTEPLIAQLRLAWWRDAITQSETINRTGEPLLAQLSGMKDTKLAATARSSMLDLLTAWEHIIVAPDDANAAHEYASRRSNAVFGGFLTANSVPMAEEVIALGRIWALQDIGLMDDPAQNRRMSPMLRKRSYRALTILAYAVQLQSRSDRGAGVKLSWHALTGR
jgi:15-cis-phytoene synthase